MKKRARRQRLKAEQCRKFVSSFWLFVLFLCKLISNGGGDTKRKVCNLNLNLPLRLNAMKYFKRKLSPLWSVSGMVQFFEYLELNLNSLKVRKKEKMILLLYKLIITLQIDTHGSWTECAFQEVLLIEFA